MPQEIIKPISVDGKITIPKKIRERCKFKRYVEVVEKDGYIEVRPHR